LGLLEVGRELGYAVAALLASSRFGLSDGEAESLSRDARALVMREPLACGSARFQTRFDLCLSCATAELWNALRPVPLSGTVVDLLNQMCVQLMHRYPPDSASPVGRLAVIHELGEPVSMSLLVRC